MPVYSGVRTHSPIALGDSSLVTSIALADMIGLRIYNITAAHSDGICREPTAMLKVIRPHTVRVLPLRKLHNLWPWDKVERPEDGEGHRCVHHYFVVTYTD